ncbi:unnamed protein product [Agarophyton chilense]
MVRQLAPTPHLRVLDCAAGTGDVARLILAAAPRAVVTAVDSNARMLRHAARRGLRTVHADAHRLPFAPNSFDAYTISFGMRNVAQPRVALAEAYRVLRPGGRFVMLEFAQVHHAVLRAVYDAYSFAVIPRVGALVARDRAAYQYLVESIRAFPKQACFARTLTDCGFRHVSVTDYSAGVAACYSAFKPAHA